MITSREFVSWRNYFKLEPWAVPSLAFAQMFVLLAAPYSKRTLKLEDFLPSEQQVTPMHDAENLRQTLMRASGGNFRR